MCLAIPMKLIEKSGRLGRVELDGVEREVGLDLLPSVETGDYVLIHAGFAIERLDEEDAMETLRLWREMEDSMNEA